MQACLAGHRPASHPRAADGWSCTRPTPTRRCLPVCRSQVFVSGARTLSAAIKPRDTAGALKEFVLQQVGVPIGRQCLYVGGKPLDDSKPLVAQGVAKGATIELRLRVSRRASEEVRKRQFWQTL